MDMTIENQLMALLSFGGHTLLAKQTGGNIRSFRNTEEDTNIEI